MTEFAEDGEADSSTGSAQIWRPPPSADPVSATTYYVADKRGNWVLGSPNRGSHTAELEGSTPLAGANGQQNTIERTIAAAAAATTTAETGQRKLGTPMIQLKPTSSATEASRSRSSSIYSQYTVPLSIVPSFADPMPMPPPHPQPEIYQKPARDGNTKRPYSGRKSRTP